MKFKTVWITHDTLMLGDEKKTYTIDRKELLKALNKIKFKATLQRKHYKLEVRK